MSQSENNNYHPSYEEIASFIEGSMGEIDEARIRVHLDCCDGCLETYRYAVRFTGTNEGLSLGDSPGKEAVRTAKAVAERQYKHKHFDRRRKRRWLSGLTPAGRTLVATAIVAVFVVAVVWLRPMPGGGFDPYSDSMVQVTDALVTASERNPLVIPGVESEISSAPATVRSGPAPVTPSLDNTLSTLATRYNEGKVSADEAQWLIGGYLATGQLENARVYLEDAVTRYPGDPDIRVLEGMLAWSGNDVERAIDRFESALREDNIHLTATFNLATVKMETGDVDTARQLFERVIQMAPDSPLAVRAKTGLSKLPH